MGRTALNLRLCCRVHKFFLILIFSVPNGPDFSLFKINYNELTLLIGCLYFGILVAKSRLKGGSAMFVVHFATRTALLSRY